MKPWSCVLFDLDGTLTDPAVGIVASFRQALRSVGHVVADDPLPAVTQAVNNLDADELVVIGGGKIVALLPHHRDDVRP